jgi:hypothetical protein
MKTVTALMAHPSWMTTVRVDSAEGPPMKPLWTIVLAAVVFSPPMHGHGEIVQGSAEAIREVVSGKVCVGDDVLKFGRSAPGASGTFNRVGRPIGTYEIGYGTIQILRGQELHGHVASVSVRDHMLYMSTTTYRCEP